MKKNYYINFLLLFSFCLFIILSNYGCSRIFIFSKDKSLRELTRKNFKLELSLKYIEEFISEGLYAEALAQSQILLSDNHYCKHPRLYMLIAKALHGLGRDEDAKLAFDLAEIAVSSIGKKDEGFQRKKEEFKQLIFSSTPTDTLQTLQKIDAKSLNPTPDKLEALITNVWFETDLRQVLLDLSQETGIPIIWDNTVQGMVTHEVKDVPISKVLSDILFSNGFVYVYRDGTYYIGSYDAESPSFSLLSETYSFQLTNIMAQDAVQLLPETYKPYVKATNTMNTVCISAPPSLAKRIIKDIRAIDSPVPQIEIEVMVVEFSITDIRKLGFDWNLNSLEWKDKTAALSVTTPEIENAVFALNFLRSPLKIGGKAVDLATSLKALSDAGVAKIRATPRLRTLNGRTATLQSLKEQYFMITGGEGGQMYGFYNRLETIQSGIHLMITPYADSSGYITVSVKPQVDDVVGEGASGLPEISRRIANTTVRVKDGETITIGGLRRHETKSVKRRIPILGSIPLLGFFFGSTEKEIVESELVIFITPYVL